MAKDHPEDVAKDTAPGAGRFKPNSATQILLAEHLETRGQSEQTVDLMPTKLSDPNIGTDPSKQNQIPPGRSRRSRRSSISDRDGNDQHAGIGALIVP